MGDRPIVQGDATALPHSDREGTVDRVLAVITSILLAVVLVAVFVDPTIGGSGPQGPGAGHPAAVGELVNRLNDVRRRFDGALVWQPVAAATELYERDSIYVAEGSTATVQLNDGSRLILDPSSLVVLRRALAIDQDTNAGQALTVELRRGGLAGQSGDRELSVRFGGSRADLAAGSRTQVQMSSGQAAKVTVTQGSAVLATQQGARVDIAKGERRSVDAEGKAAASADRLTIELVSPAAGARVLAGTGNLEFSWRRLGGEPEAPMVFELATDSTFNHVMSRQVSTSQRAWVGNPKAGVYYWRIKRKAAGAASSGPVPAGLIASEERSLIVVPDTKPLIISPRREQVIDVSVSGALPLTWTEIPEAVSYLVELQPDGGGASHQLTSTKAVLLVTPSQVELFEGGYSVRVRAVTADKLDMGWSESVRFRVVIKPVLRAPELYDPNNNTPEQGKPKKGAWWWMLIGSTAYAAADVPPSAGADPLVLRWEKVPGAEAYIVEIARDSAFMEVIAHERAPAPYLKWQPPAKRNYFWRVRAVDAAGREGQWSEARRLVFASPQAPTLIDPAEGSEFELVRDTIAIEVRWTTPSADATSRYLVQVSRDRTFTKLVSSTEATAMHAACTLGAVGAYYVRVLPFDVDGQKGPPSESHSLIIKPAPPSLVRPVEATPPMASTTSALAGTKQAATSVGAVAFEWKGRSGSTYQLQVATSDKFEPVAHLAEVKSTTTSLPLGPGEYFWRVRTMRPPSRWSSVGHFVVSAPALAQTPPPAVTIVQSGGAEGRALGDGAPVPGSGAGPGPGAERSTVAHMSASAPPFSVSSRLGFSYRPDGVVVPRPGVEIRHILDAWPGLALCLGLSYYTYGGSEPAAPVGGAQHERVHALPLEILVSFESYDLFGSVFATPLALRVALGAVLAPAIVSVSRRDAAARREAMLEGGGVASVGLAQPAGPGEAVADLVFAMATGRDGLVNSSPGGVQLALGYRLGL